MTTPLPPDPPARMCSRCGIRLAPRGHGGYYCHECTQIIRLRGVSCRISGCDRRALDLIDQLCAHHAPIYR